MALHHIFIWFLLWNRVDAKHGKCNIAAVPLKHALHFNCNGFRIPEVVEYLSSLKKDPDISSDKDAAAILSNPIQLTLERTVFPYAANDVILKRGKMNFDWLNVDMKVQLVCIQNSNIFAISNYAFRTSQFINLEVFELIDVPIHEIYTKSLSGLKNLRILALRNIQLNYVGLNILQPCIKLEVFTMYRCGPEKIWLINFFGSSEYNRLHKVDIEVCNLDGTINDVTFWGLKALKDLRLRNCNIKKIGRHSFDMPLGTLTQLNLDFNQLTTLPKGIFKNAGNNITISLRDNPWHCDCKLNDLKDFIQRKTNVIFYNVICKSPADLKGAILISLPSMCKKSTIKNAVENVFKQKEIIQSNNQIERAIIHGDHQTEKAISQIEKEVTSTKPLPESTSMVANKNEQLLIDDWNSSKERYIIGFEQKLLEGGKKFRTKCLTKSNESKKINIEKDLKPNRMYRFCTMKKGSTTITPSNCVSFISAIEPKVELIKGDALITMEHRMFSIISFILNSIFVFLIGVSGSIVTAKCFPNKFQAICLPKDENKAANGNTE